MRKEGVAVLMVIAVLGGAGVGYLLGSNPTVVQTSQSSAKTTTCTVVGTTMGVVIRVIGGAGTIAGAHISGEDVGYCNNRLYTSTLQPTITNSSGWATLLDGGFGTYNLIVSYRVENLSNSPVATYNLSVPTQPLAVTFVLFDTSSGNVTTHFCGFNYHCSTGATGS